LLSLSIIVISRAGMNFLTELSCLGKASIIIPMPGTHQEDNARFFSDQEAAVYLDQNIMDAENLSAQIKKMLEDKDYRSGFERRISRAMKMGAAENLLRVIKDIIC
jgi:UDP-N-acetylglucosamine--N-acetylmuramyl-(pentapeptide) pyrophosphoryl-undecaprenol N-acetylglucosamine transferase